MLALLSAGLDHRRALLTVCDKVRETAIRAQHNPQDAFSLLTELTLLADPNNLLSNPIDSTVALQVEERHFAGRAKQNDAIRRYQAEKRKKAKREAKPHPTITLFDESPLSTPDEATLETDFSDEYLADLIKQGENQP